MGVVGVEDFPYYAYGGYPSGARRVPIHNLSFPSQWSGDYSPYYNNSVYGGNSAPGYVVVQRPSSEDANVVRKRKQDGLKREVISSGERDARNALVENVSNSGATPSTSIPVPSPVLNSSKATQATRMPQASPVYSAELKRPSSSVAERSSSHARVVSIPVVSMDDDRNSSVKCTVMSQEGIKKMRKAMSSQCAATLIQARFRGTQVRNTLPLLQLRQIAKVKSQLVEFAEKAADIDFINYARENSAAKVKLTEGLMKLLLQLDAIQGAHPTVREIRKLATKDVISLQGRVDALLSTDASSEVLSQLPMETAQAIGDDKSGDIVRTTEALVNVCTDISTVGLDEGTRMQLVDPKQGDRDVEKLEPNLERMEIEAAELETIEVNKSDVDDLKRFESEADEHHRTVAENEFLSNLRHENGDKVGEISLALAETISEALGGKSVNVGSVETNTTDEGMVQSEDASESSQESSQGNEEINELSVHDDGDIVHPLNEKGSLLPYSPRSPFDTVECPDFSASNSDSEHQSELQATHETSTGGLTQGTAETQALLVKLSEENKSLKSLLITVMKWNQMQATTMQEVNHRLGKLESKILPRADKKANSRRKGYSKSSRMML